MYPDPVGQQRDRTELSHVLASSAPQLSLQETPRVLSAGKALLTLSSSFSPLIPPLRPAPASPGLNFPLNQSL